jgi:hypothetical protein
MSFISGITALSWALVSSLVSESFFFYTDGRTTWTSEHPVARPLPTHRTTQTQASMSLSGIRTHNPSVGASEDS